MKANNNTECRCNGCTSGIIAGLIFGVITAVLFSLGITELILNGIWVALGFAGLSLIYIMALAAISSFGENFSVLRQCLIRNIRCLIVSIFGSIISSVVLVSVTLNIASMITTIIVGALAFFFMLLIFSIISIIKCLIYR